MGRYGPDRQEEENTPYFYSYSVGERRLIELLTTLVLAQHKIVLSCQSLELKMEKIMTAVDDLNAAVDKVTAAVNVAVADIKTLSDELLNAQGDPAAVTAAVTRLNAISDQLSAATPSDG